MRIGVCGLRGMGDPLRKSPHQRVVLGGEKRGASCVFKLKTRNSPMSKPRYIFIFPGTSGD